MASKSEVQGLINEVLVRLRSEEKSSLEVVRSPTACPDGPGDEGLTRRDVIGKLSLLLAGAAAFKMQGCGACNDFPSSYEDDAGADGGDAGEDDDCSLDADCTSDEDCTTDGDCSLDEECSTDCAADECSTDCAADECSTDCAADCAADSCTTDCSFDCSYDSGCTTDSSSFF